MQHQLKETQKGGETERKPVSQAQIADGRGSPTPAQTPQVRPPPTPTGSSQTLPTVPKSFRSTKPSRGLAHPQALRGGETETPKGKKDPGPAEQTQVHATPHSNPPSTMRPPDSVPTAGTEGHFSAPEGRYLVAGPLVLLHGGFGSPRGRSKATVGLRNHALASGEAPPLLLAQGFCLRRPRLCVALEQSSRDRTRGAGAGIKGQGGGALIELSRLARLRVPPRPRVHFRPGRSSESKGCMLRARPVSGED